MSDACTCVCSFKDLRCKDVINVCDGVNLGHACDIELDVSECPPRLMAIIVPGPARMFGILRNDEELVIPYHCINKIGDDVILVEVTAKKC